MNHRDRFHKLMRFEAVDRLPMIEWAGYWDQTLARWKREGLSPDLEDAAEIREHLGLDAYRQCWIVPRKESCPEAGEWGRGVISDIESYRRIRDHLYPKTAFDEAAIAEWAAQRRRGAMVVWISLEGFFWFPRTLLGIERHLAAFYEQPGVIHAINRDILEFHLRILDAFCGICTPDFMTFAEDMSYNHGPMISQALFEEFLAPYYAKILPRVRQHGVVPFVDTDGNVDALVGWFTDLGIEGFLPLERQAGVDVVALRERHPRLKMIGGFDKMVMSKGEAAMRAEFERLLPVMRQGGFIPSVDHQTPPEVSFEDYKTYLRLLKTYCETAVPRAPFPET